MSVPRPDDQILSRHDTPKFKPVFPFYVDKIIKWYNYGYFIMFLLCGLLMSKINSLLFYPALLFFFSFFSLEMGRLLIFDAGIGAETSFLALSHSIF